jgi:hypothetical protein
VQRCQLQPRTSRSQPSARRAHLRWRAERRPASARPSRAGSRSRTSGSRPHRHRSRGSPKGPSDGPLARVTSALATTRPPSSTFSTITGIGPRAGAGDRMRFVVAAPLRTAGVRCHQVSIHVNAHRRRKRQERPHAAASLLRIYSALRRADSRRSAHSAIGASATRGASHIAEVQYLFDLRNVMNPDTRNAQQHELGSSMRQYWDGLAADGVPSSAGDATWPAFDSDNQRMISLLPRGPST